MKKNLIVSAVRKVKDKVVVHYTDGTVKEFTIPEWEYSYGQGRRPSQSEDLGTIPENLRTLPHLWLLESRQFCFRSQQILLTPNSLVHA